MGDYTWCITADLIDGTNGGAEGGAVGRSGPPDAPHVFHDVVIEGEAFRLVGMDGTVYYRGYILGEYRGLEPLDEFGQPYAGCSGIEYLRGENWEAPDKR